MCKYSGFLCSIKLIIYHYPYWSSRWSNPRDSIVTFGTWNEPLRPDPWNLWLFMYRIVLKTVTWNIHKILHNVLQLFHRNLGSICLIVWKLCAFMHRRNFGNCGQFFFIITLIWKGNFKFWWFCQKYLAQIYQNQLYFKFKWLYFRYKIPFLGENMRFFLVFSFELLSKYNYVYKFWWLHRKDLIKIYQKLS